MEKPSIFYSSASINAHTRTGTHTCTCNIIASTLSCHYPSILGRRQRRRRQRRVYGCRISRKMHFVSHRSLARTPSTALSPPQNAGQIIGRPDPGAYGGHVSWNASGETVTMTMVATTLHCFHCSWREANAKFYLRTEQKL